MWLDPGVGRRSLGRLSHGNARVVLLLERRGSILDSSPATAIHGDRWRGFRSGHDHARVPRLWRDEPSRSHYDVTSDGNDGGSAVVFQDQLQCKRVDLHQYARWLSALLTW